MLCDVLRFNRCRDLSFKEIDSGFVMQYSSYLNQRKLSTSTVAFYVRAFRAVYNRAVEEGMTKGDDVFKGVYTGVFPRVKDKSYVPIELIRQIRDLELPTGSLIDLARDMFLFSFYNRGMSFIDIAYLRLENIGANYMHYIKRSSNSVVSIMLEDCVSSLIDKYKDSSRQFIFPIITIEDQDYDLQCSRSQIKINSNFKKISNLIEGVENLNFEIAKNSWAAMVFAKTIPLSVIFEAFGHKSEKETIQYVESLGLKVSDLANRIMLQSL